MLIPHAPQLSAIDTIYVEIFRTVPIIQMQLMQTYWQICTDFDMLKIVAELLAGASKLAQSKKMCEEEHTWKCFSRQGRQ